MNDTQSKRKVVVIGGGTGLPVILNNLKNQYVDITAIVNISDDGGSSGRLRNEINIVPPGDIRNVLVSLSNLSKDKLDLFQYRFNKGDHFLSEHSLGNLIIAAMTEMKGDVNIAVEALSQMMDITGKIYPATNEKLQLCAEFEDGTTMTGEYEITYADKKINRVWVESNDGQTPHANQKVIDAILSADQIVLGPGSLFTSILPNLMIKNLGEAVLASKAQVVYICNIMTQKGETDHFSDAQHVEVLNRHMKSNFIDVVIVNKQPVDTSIINREVFNEIENPVKHDEKAVQAMGCECIYDDFLMLSHQGAFHDGKKVADTLCKLVSKR
ncbi:Putative gluconeogenesis factor [Apilactobacillus kunkeei]|nr:Putative gluconeogenesis factor [Apilactobacillus kunkeei]CAI2576692.1 Putative gluconeogenesis factor [Apilactobacillus kunkeei]CAI2801622.1 Putative gluconeogenesis factor [Apilactobacillus kunkeei]